MKQYTAKERLVRHGREIWKNRAAYLLMAPFMVIFFVFTVFPVLMTIVLSFTEYNILQEPTWVGWQNYRDLFVNDKEFAIALRNTVVFALITGPVGYFLSFFAAWIINEFRPVIRGILTFIFYIPTISGTVYTIWGILFSGDMYGYANSFLL